MVFKELGTFFIFVNKHNDVVNANGIIPVSQNGWRAAEELLEQFVALEITKNERMLTSDHESNDNGNDVIHHRNDRPSKQSKSMGKSMGKSMKKSMGKSVHKTVRKSIKKSKGIFACCLACCACCTKMRGRKKRSHSGKGSYQMTRNISNSGNC